MEKNNFVVVVEDQSCVRDAVDRLLASAGYAVRGFSSAEDLLQAGIDGVCCLVLDLGLPGMTGWELHRELAMGPCPPVIFITGDDDIEGRLRRLALESGASAFLRKPFDGEELLRAVRQAHASSSSAASQFHGLLA